MAEVVGLSTQIVAILKQYRRIPVDFLARRLGRHTSEIREDLESLEREGVLERDGEQVTLSEKSA